MDGIMAQTDAPPQLLPPPAHGTLKCSHGVPIPGWPVCGTAALRIAEMAPSVPLLFRIIALGSLLLQLSVGRSAGGSSRGGALALSRRKNVRRDDHVAHPPQQSGSHHHVVAGLRGGSAVAGEGLKTGGEAVRSIKVLVSTTKISSFVDAVCTSREVSHATTRVCSLFPSRPLSRPLTDNSQPWEMGGSCSFSIAHAGCTFLLKCKMRTTSLLYDYGT